MLSLLPKNVSAVMGNPGTELQSYLRQYLRRLQFYPLVGGRNLFYPTIPPNLTVRVPIHTFGACYITSITRIPPLPGVLRPC